LISFSDRRVLDELDPDSTQSARDRQPIQNRAAGTLFARWSHQRPEIPIQSIHSKTRKHLAIPRRARLAFQLEARLTQSTILSNVARHTKHTVIRHAELDAWRFSNLRAWLTGSWQTFQETPDTQWQKN
jgi:hypothetical protein